MALVDDGRYQVCEMFKNDVYIQEILNLYIGFTNNYSQQQEKVFEVYDELFNNIDNIISQYQKS